MYAERETGDLYFSPDGGRLAYVSLEHADVVVLDLAAKKGQRVGCTALWRRGAPRLRGWTADGTALLFEGANRARWRLDPAFPAPTLRRLWPTPWEGQVSATPITTLHVPLEPEDLVRPTGSMKVVPPNVAEVRGEVRDLPVQVVPEEAPTEAQGR